MNIFCHSDEKVLKEVMDNSEGGTPPMIRYNIFNTNDITLNNLGLVNK